MNTSVDPLQHQNSLILQHQNSLTSFRELRKLSKAAAAKAIGVSPELWGHWERGARPRLKYLRLLAKLLDTALPEMIRLLWREQIGDPCECGCGREKILPENENALHLWFSGCCETCGNKLALIKFRFYRHWRKRCRHCAPSRKSLGIENFFCVGGKPFKSLRKPIFADKCRGSQQIARRRFKYYRDIDDGLHSFINPITGEYRCNRCANKLLGIDRHRKDVIEFMEAAKEAYGPERFFELTGLRHKKDDDTLPRVQSLSALRTLSKAAYKLLEAARKEGKKELQEYTQPRTGKLKVFARTCFQPGRKRQSEPWKKERPRAITDPRRIGILFHYATRRVETKDAAGVMIRVILPRSVKRLCQLEECGRIVFAHTPKLLRFHQPCYWKLLAKRHQKVGKPGEVVTESKGVENCRPRQRETLQTHYLWVIRRLKGDTIDDIAKDFGKSGQGVIDGMKDFLSLLPSRDVQTEGFWPLLGLLENLERDLT